MCLSKVFLSFEARLRAVPYEDGLVKLVLYLKVSIMSPTAKGRERMKCMRKSIVLVMATLMLAAWAGVLVGAEPNDANQAVKAQPAVKMVEPVGWWKLDEKEGNTVSDSSGNGFNAEVILSGGASVWAPGQGVESSGCAQFAAKQIIVIPNGVWGKVKDKMSISFWVNQDPNNPPGETWPGPFGCAPAEGKNYPDADWLALRAFLPSPNLTIDIGKDEAHVYWSPPDADAYAGKWNHYVYVHDANESAQKLYHNGELVGSNFTATEPMPKLNNFMLGGRTYPTGDWFGKIDDFRIYNSALSDDDVMKIYNAKGGK